MMHDYIIIGAGISGLSAGYKFKEYGLSGLVLEASAKPGGSVESTCVDNLCYELGAHSVFNTYQNFIEIYQSLEQSPQLLEKQGLPFLIWQDGKISSVVSKLSIPKLFFSLTKLPWQNKHLATVDQYYAKIVGDTNYDNVIKHALNAVSCQDAGAMPADFLFKKRPKNRAFKRKFSFVGGIQSALNSMADGLNVEYNTKAVNITQDENENFIINEKFTTKKLLLAVPVNILPGLLSEIDPQLATDLSAIKYTEFNSVLVVANANEVSHIKKCAGWIGVNADFYSMVSSDVLGYPTMRGFTFHFKSGDLDKQIAKALDILSLQESEVIKIVSKQNVLPRVTPATRKINITAKNFGLSGNFISGMSLEDCIVRSFYEVTRLCQEKP